MKPPLLASAALALCLSADAAAAEPKRGPRLDERRSAPLRAIDPALRWYGDNRARLDALIGQYGVGSPGYDAAHKPVAAFDWDNTVVRNDVGDATLFWMIRNGKLRQPPRRNWRFVSPLLTPEAATALGSACAGGAAGALPTERAACAAEIMAVYTTGKTAAGRPAFSGWNARQMEPSYAFGAQIYGGLRATELRDFAARALAENLAAPEGAVQTVGGVAGLSAWIRIYDQQRDLIRALQQHGWDVWVVSASPQPVVEAAAARVGVAADRVIGIRLVERGGVLSADLQGCGGIPDGSNDGAGRFRGNELITYIEGKRCWINKVIYGIEGAAALQRAPVGQRPRLAAGDAETDVTFLQDATGLKLVLNRNKGELMCNAYHNAGGRWLVQPLFIAPLRRQAAPYPCATTACKDEAGTPSPCRDEEGRPIADQEDRVFAGDDYSMRPSSR